MFTSSEIQDIISDYLRDFTVGEMGPTLNEMSEDLYLDKIYLKDPLDILVDSGVIRVDEGRYYYNTNV